jgi:hypothetical protein
VPRSTRPGTARSWVSASDLADYVYCPRSYWYSLTRPEAGFDPSARRRLERGNRYHEQYLGAVAHRELHPARAWAWLALGLALIGLAAAIFLR